MFKIIRNLTERWTTTTFSNTHIEVVRQQQFGNGQDTNSNLWLSETHRLLDLQIVRLRLEKLAKFRKSIH